MNLTNEIASLEATMAVLQSALQTGEMSVDNVYPKLDNSIDAIYNVIESLKNKTINEKD